MPDLSPQGSIVALVTALATLALALIKIFKKSTTEKVSEERKETRDELDEFRKTGRPPK